MHDGGEEVIVERALNVPDRVYHRAHTLVGIAQIVKLGLPV